MLRILCYLLITTYILLATAALPIAVANKKDSKFCCKCTVDEDESTGKAATNLGIGLINTVNVMTHSLIGAGLVIPPVQIRVPQAHFPALFNIIPQQSYMFYHFEPFINLQQPKVSTQCCVPCPDGNGICCCTPGATTAAPRDSHTSHITPQAGAEVPLKSTSLLVGIVILLLLDYIL
ncbi:hypothetical protein ACH3XW_6180 [Acanthocheilonema viteae]|uniref:CX domain-containing protein n=1 Tax=Acanthocheilonema viteae TaxID=6277 RepID=A0A498S1T3_ACAVI|nr:unnamed protein product [Acanthocheilonema viteae]